MFGTKSSAHYPLFPLQQGPAHLLSILQQLLMIDCLAFWHWPINRAGSCLGPRAIESQPFSALNKAIFILLLVQICLIQFSSLIMLKNCCVWGTIVCTPHISPLVHATLPGSHGPTCSGWGWSGATKLPFSLPFRGDEKEIIRRGIKIIALVPAAIVATGMRCGVLHKMELFTCHLNNVLQNHCISAIGQRRRRAYRKSRQRSSLASLS